MYERPRRARVLFVVLLLAAVTVITLDFREQRGGPIERLQHTAISVFSPVQRGVTAVLSPIGGLFGGVNDLRNLKRDNTALTTEVERLRTHERSYADLSAENQALRRTMAMADRCGCRTVGAKVVARSGSNLQRMVTIDAGSRQGIAEGMAVINADGLVGRVVQVTDGYSGVLLLADPSSGVAAILGGTRAPGLLKGRGHPDLELELLQPDAKVQVGEPVMTRGYQDGVFPAGVPIGVVSAVPPDSDLVRRIKVRPFASAESLDLVAVVLDKPASPPAGPRVPRPTAPLPSPDLPLPSPPTTVPGSPPPGTGPDAPPTTGPDGPPGGTAPQGDQVDDPDRTGGLAPATTAPGGRR